MAEETGASLFEITSGDLSVDEVVSRVASPSIGAVASFVGVARDHTGDRQVNHLEYEHYPGMAEEMLQQVGDEIQARWTSIEKVAIVHRVGRLEPGEISTVIALCSAHREEVFDALRYAIDRLKEIVPIWKKEIWADGAEWKCE